MLKAMKANDVLNSRNITTKETRFPETQKEEQEDALILDYSNTLTLYM